MATSSRKQGGESRAASMLAKDDLRSTNSAASDWMHGVAMVKIFLALPHR